jgi:hypothetical protein
MIESIVELLFGLFWSALILLVGSSIVGSIVAALRGVSHESDYGPRTQRRSSASWLKRPSRKTATAISPTEAKLSEQIALR